MLKFDITVGRTTKKRLSPEKRREQLQFIADAACRNFTNRWKADIPQKLLTEEEIGDGDFRQLRYTAVIQLVKERYLDAEVVKRNFKKTQNIMARAARRMKWNLLSDEALMPVNGQLQVINGVGELMGDPAPRILKKLSSSSLELPPLTDEVMKKHFGRIYSREPHIRIIYDNLKTAVRTKFKARHHILLKGKPSCAKSELYMAFVDWLGSDYIEEVDASTMTKAGLERLLQEKASSGTLKPILVMEEIEKCHPENVSCLIQVMDGRGRIQRVNAHTVRDGDSDAISSPIIIWGTCNNENVLKNFFDKAIWSRFSNKLDCDRPDRALMEKILCREVIDIEGKSEWVPVVLDFCYNELANIPKFKDEFDDPRLARALLAGGDRLLDKSYLKDIREACKIGDNNGK